MAVPCDLYDYIILIRVVILEVAHAAAAVTDNLRLGRFLLEALTIIPRKSLWRTISLNMESLSM